MKKIKVKPEKKKVAVREFNSVEFFNAHLKKIISSVIIIIVVVVWVVFLWTWHGNRKSFTSVMISQANSLLEREDYAAALALYQQFLTERVGHPLIPAALLDAGFCCKQLGDDQRARDYFTELREKFPGSAWDDEARQELDRMSAE